jgi:hypothetical protein
MATSASNTVKMVRDLLNHWKDINGGTGTIITKSELRRAAEGGTESEAAERVAEKILAADDVFSRLDRANGDGADNEFSLNGAIEILARSLHQADSHRNLGTIAKELTSHSDTFEFIDDADGNKDGKVTVASLRAALTNHIESGGYDLYKEELQAVADLLYHDHEFRSMARGETLTMAEIQAHL